MLLLEKAFIVRFCPKSPMSTALLEITASTHREDGCIDLSLYELSRRAVQSPTTLLFKPWNLVVALASVDKPHYRQDELLLPKLAAEIEEVGNKVAIGEYRTRMWFYKQGGTQARVLWIKYMKEIRNLRGRGRVRRRW